MRLHWLFQLDGCGDTLYMVAVMDVWIQGGKVTDVIFGLHAFIILHFVVFFPVVERVICVALQCGHNSNILFPYDLLLVNIT